MLILHLRTRYLVQLFITYQGFPDGSRGPMWQLTDFTCSFTVIWKLFPWRFESNRTLAFCAFSFCSDIIKILLGKLTMSHHTFVWAKKRAPQWSALTPAWSENKKEKMKKRKSESFKNPFFLRDFFNSNRQFSNQKWRHITIFYFRQISDLCQLYP